MKNPDNNKGNHEEREYSFDPNIQKCLQIFKEGKEPPKTLSNLARALEMWETVENW